MFTGIALGKGTLTKIEDAANMMRLFVDHKGLLTGKLVLGNSVMVNGVCLSITSVNGSVISFDAIPETLDKTNLGALSVGDPVNIEPPLAFGDEMGGHYVQGHVEFTAAITAVEKSDHSYRITLKIPNLSDHAAIVPKGYIAIDGCSLTVAGYDAAASTIDIALIPETLNRTTLGVKKEGATVNIETDMSLKSTLKAAENLMASLDARLTAVEEKVG